MLNRLATTYRATWEQAFLPIFTAVPLDSRRLVEGAVEAGCRVLEFTLRSPDAREMIPWIRREFPDVHLLVGSTIDSDRVVRQMRRRHPQLMTLDEVADLDVHGFVSMVGWSRQSIERWAPTHLIAPTADTVSEALMQTDAGAHFQKLNGADVPLIRRCRGLATFGFCPVFVTGGQTPEQMPVSFGAGAVLVAAGFDLFMAGAPADVGVAQVAEAVRRQLDAAREARVTAWGDAMPPAHADWRAWLDALPHWHPFQQD